MRTLIACMLLLGGMLVHAQSGCAKDFCVHIENVQQSGPSVTSDGKKISLEVWEIPVRFVEVKKSGKVEVKYPSRENSCKWEKAFPSVGKPIPATGSVILVITILDGKHARWALL